MQDALTRAVTSLLRVLGITLLIIIVPFVLMMALVMLFFALGGTIVH
ncbi:hypothetical protein ACICHK_34725 [Streptomyces sp. AHU1]